MRCLVLHWGIAAGDYQAKLRAAFVMPGFVSRTKAVGYRQPLELALKK